VPDTIVLKAEEDVQVVEARNNYRMAAKRLVMFEAASTVKSEPWIPQLPDSDRTPDLDKSWQEFD
jgi:hypothetical protein